MDKRRRNRINRLNRNGHTKNAEALDDLSPELATNVENQSLALARVGGDEMFDEDLREILEDGVDSSNYSPTELQERMMTKWVELGEMRGKSGHRLRPTFRDACKAARIPRTVFERWRLDASFVEWCRTALEVVSSGMVPLIKHRLGIQAMDGDVPAAKLFLQIHDPESLRGGNDPADLSGVFRYGSRKRVRVIEGEITRITESADSSEGEDAS